MYNAAHHQLELVATSYLSKFKSKPKAGQAKNIDFVQKFKLTDFYEKVRRF